MHWDGDGDGDDGVFVLRDLEEMSVHIVVDGIPVEEMLFFCAWVLDVVRLDLVAIRLSLSQPPRCHRSARLSTGQRSEHLGGLLDRNASPFASSLLTGG